VAGARGTGVPWLGVCCTGRWRWLTSAPRATVYSG
jgi:hypothetical protein